MPGAKDEILLDEAGVRDQEMVQILPEGLCEQNIAGWVCEGCWVRAEGFGLDAEDWGWGGGGARQGLRVVTGWSLGSKEVSSHVHQSGQLTHLGALDKCSKDPTANAKDIGRK